ncbi:MAG: SAM-dependent methyltransferase [Lachnospiraceae bacterium]|nr:SAM-dependent methyltransferase [Lachnospiraceae bacterium]
MHLSKRLLNIAGMVTPGNRLVDVGTDHGYVPIYLMQKGVINEALAMDINKGPLVGADKHIEEAGFTGKIRTRLSDGLKEYKKGEGDTILIAGMGGALVVKILSSSIDKLEGIKELVLSPQSEIFLVREFLKESGFVIQDEKMVYDEEKYYTIIKAVPGEDSNTYSEWEMHYGYKMLEKRDEVLREFLEKEYKNYNKIFESLDKQTSDIAKIRKQEIEDKVKGIEKVIKMYY